MDTVLAAYLVALAYVPGAQEALIGEAVVGDLDSWKTEAALWAVHTDIHESVRLIKLLSSLN